MCTYRAWETIVGQQAGSDLLLDGFGDLFPAMTCICDKNSGRPVDPAVAKRVVNLEPFGPVPHDRWLAAHSERLEPREGLERRERFRNRQRGVNPPISCVDRWNAARR